MTASRVFLLAIAVGIATACTRSDPAHEHASGHDHGEGATEQDETEPIAITRWTERHELFVEFPSPTPGKPVAFHAHVTQLDGFRAVTEGRFRVRFSSGSAVAAEVSIDRVKRAGIFTPEVSAPAAGRYQLEMTYEHGGVSDVFDCGVVEVGDAKSVAVEAPEAALSFLKEQQWQIAFATAWAKKQPISREIELPATVEPAGGDQLTVGAPTGGRFFHNPKLGIAEGLRVEKGAVVGFIAPNVAGDDFGRLQLSLDEARIEKDRTEREVLRIEPLVRQGLIPERRLIELKSEVDANDARLRSARSRLGRVVAPGGSGGLAIKSTIGGVVSQVLVANGEPVDAGAPLLRIGGTDHVWIRARFVARPAPELANARPLAVTLPDTRRVDLSPERARLLSALPAVDAQSRVASWIVDVASTQTAPVPAAQPPRDLVPGTSVVLTLAVGAPRTALAVLRSAVVEINTRPFVFVQADGENFEKRAVALGSASGDLVEIVEGVREGERIVTLGGFDIHLASLMGTVESHRH